MSRPRQVVTIAKGVNLAFRLVPAGTFRMGQRGIRADEEPVHSVRITRDFWMMETPVTQAQFAAWKADHKSHFAGQADHPVEQVTWHDAAGFAGSLQKSVTGDWVACLPTEAEWEYACRAGTTSQFYCGETDKLKQVAWFDRDWNKGSTHPVRSKGAASANGFGLFDMHGNVREWCFDEYDWAAYRSRTDGVADPGWKERAKFNFAESKTKARNKKSLRVLRGGSWCNSAAICRAAVRDWEVAGYGDRIIGFRVVLVTGPQAQPVGDRNHGRERS